jgi:hypothetical protein
VVNGVDGIYPAGPVETFRRIVADLREKERNAARRAKPTMWAYYGGMADDLEAYFSDVTLSDGGFAGAALALSQKAERKCPDLPRLEAAHLWALSVYCRRILSAWTPGEPLAGYRPGLGWLRERAGVA